jgi:hypothetical protein
MLMELLINIIMNFFFLSKYGILEKTKQIQTVLLVKSNKREDIWVTMQKYKKFFWFLSLLIGYGAQKVLNITIGSI